MKIKFDRKVLLGVGGYGSVFPGTFQGNKVAVKRVLIPIGASATDNEEDALKQLEHPNIIKCLHCETDATFKYFDLELCDASLDQIFLQPNHPRKYKGPRLPHHSTVFSQLASGLEYIHSKNLIHRDIKPENVLIHVDSTTDQVTIKWADFGLSRSVNERGTFTMSGIRGTNCWFAPEELTSGSQGQQSKQAPRGTVKSDVFTQDLVFAILLLDGQHLYGSAEMDIHANILANKPININKIHQSHYALDLIKKMLEREPGNRISSKTVVVQLKSIEGKLAEKEKELGQLCIDTSLLDLAKIQSLIQLGIDVNRKSTEEVNILHLLCANNSSDKIIGAIKLLIQGGIDVNGKDKYGSNALHYLCRYNSNEKLIDAIQSLIQGGIDVNSKDKDGRNALHYLCANNSSVKITKAIRLLIQLGIGINGKDKDGQNALHYLCRYNSSARLTDAIKLLIIELKIELNGKNKYGSNALHLLCAKNSSDKLIDAIKLLIQHGIDVNGKDKDGWNALQYLCLNTSSERLIDAIKVLIQLGIDVKSFGIETRNLLHKNSTLNKRKENVDAIIQLLDKAALAK